MPQVTIQIAKTEDRIKFLSNLSKLEIQNKIGLKVEELDDSDIKKLKIVETMTKLKKPLEYVIEFDDKGWFTLSFKIGTWKHEFNARNLIEDKSIKDRKEVVKNLVVYGAATKKQMDM